MPVFSIIIPVYNVEKYIKDCIESVINQTFTDFEAIFVDDCGQDNSIHIVEEYAKTDSRIKILYHEKNKGLSAARNTALDASVGKYLVCIDSDDWLEQNALEFIYDEFKKRNTTIIWFEARKYFADSESFGKDTIINSGQGYLTITPHNILNLSDYSWAKAYLTESIKKYNIKWPEGLFFEDAQFHFEYFTFNPHTYITKQCLYNYRIRSGSICTNYCDGIVRLEDIYKIIKNVRQFYIDNNVYEKYKIALLKLIQNRIDICKGIKNNHELSIELSDNLLREVSYPSEFRDFDVKLNPLVSVIVPVYNTELYLEKCIRSIQKQSYRNLEIICIDDCSTDDSAGILDAFQKKDERIKIIRHSENKGVSVSRNEGIDFANGDYIFFVDPDDWIDKNLIEVVTSKFNETNLKTVWFKSFVFWDKTQKLEPFWAHDYMNQPEGFFSVDNTNFFSLPQYAWKVAYKASVLKNSDIRFPEGILFEDMVFYTKLFTKYPETYMIDKMLYTYRRHESSLVSNCTNNVDYANNLYYANKMIYEYLKQENLLEKYYVSFINFVKGNIDMFVQYPEVHSKFSPLMTDFYNEILSENKDRKLV